LLWLLACELTSNSPHTPSVHILDDDSLLNVFYLYRLSLLDKDNDDDDFKMERQYWVSERWWHPLTHVCQRWRNLIIGSASYLRLSLLCTKGTPVVDMLAHSPPLPLVIEFTEIFLDISVEDEEGVIFALTQRNRVRSVRLYMPIAYLAKFIVAIEKEYPILECLIIWSWNEDDTTFLMFPETFHAPHLHHLALRGLTLPIGSQLLTAATRLVTLRLIMSSPSTYFHPNTLLQWLSFMPQLETLNISPLFRPNGDGERQLTQPPVMTPVTLPNLRHVLYHGHISTYLDTLVHYITPFPEKLELYFFVDFSNQNTFSVPHLVRFMKTAWNLKFESAKFEFSNWKASVVVYPRGEAEMCALTVTAESYEFDWLVSYVAQVSNSFGQIFSAVERLTLEYVDVSRDWSSNELDLEENGFNRIEWHQLLCSFSNVKTLRIDNEFVKMVSRCLESDGGGVSSGLLPELQELTFFQGDESGDEFTSFVDTRQNAGRSITLSHY
jgi:hypothetical protein